MNVATTVAALGISVSVITRVGDDKFGRYLTTHLDQAGVDTSAVIVDPARPTVLYIKQRGGGSAAAGDLPRGESRMLYYRNGSAVMTDKIAILTEDAPAPAHSFSQAVRKGLIVQISGQGPADPTTNEYVHLGDLTGRTHRTLQNILAIANAAGATFADVVMLRVYLTTRDDFAEMNTAYQDFVTKHSGDAPLPCQVITGLPREEVLIEIDALAVVSP